MILAIYATIWAAVALFVLGEIGRAKENGWGRTASAAGLALAIVHTLLAFDVFHHWDHAEALAATAQQTQDVFGVRFGAGVYVNYLFLAVWMIDVALWRPHDRPSSGVWLLRAFYLLIIFNGAIVFAAGWRRLLGLLLVAVLLTAWGKRGHST